MSKFRATQRQVIADANQLREDKRTMRRQMKRLEMLFAAFAMSALVMEAQIPLPVTSSSTFLDGQALPPLTKQPEAQSLVGHIRAAYGPALRKNEATFAQGTIEIAGVSGVYPFRIYAMGNRFVRTEIDQPAGTSVRILNGDQAAYRSYGGKTIHMTSINSIGERLLYMPDSSLMSEFNDPEIELRYIGSAQLSGVSVVQFSAAWSSASRKEDQNVFLKRTQVVYSVDPNTYHIIQVEYDRCAENDTNDLTHFRLVYSDYQLLGGRPIATTITEFANDKLFSEMHISSFQDNSDVSSEMFSLQEVQK